MTDEVSDDRVDGLASSQLEGFANWAIMWIELRSLAAEVKRYRERPLHCPTCDGDHL
jgi:hypothetical protein